MSRLIMWNLITLDGFFEGAKSWDLDWHRHALGEAFDRFALEQLRSADRLLFGRVTYEGMAAYWPAAQGEIAGFMNRLPKVVFSRTLAKAAWCNTTLIRDDPAAAVGGLKRQAGGNMFVFGSAKLCDTLIDAGLFDEYRLGLTSVILGRGRPLFSERAESIGLRLVESRPLSAGCVVLRYEPAVSR